MRRTLFALAFHAVLGGLPATADAQVAALAERPVLVLDPGMHTAPIIRLDVDRDARFVVTGSHDKTVRVWSAEDRRLLRTIRMPQGPGDVGKIYAVARRTGRRCSRAAGTSIPPE